MRILCLALAVIALFCAAAGPAVAAAKDETIEDWIPLPKEIGEWRKMMADRGFAFGINWVGDNIGNVTGGTKRTAIHQGRFDRGRDRSLGHLVKNDHLVGLAARLRAGLEAVAERRLVGVRAAPDDRVWQERAKRQRYVSYAMAALVGTIGFLMSTKPQLW